MEVQRTSLRLRSNPIAEPSTQRKILNKGSERLASLARFEDRLRESGLEDLTAQKIEILQINLGKMCNQVCAHCHVDAGPDRREIMSRQTLEDCLDALRAQPMISAVDLTGGAPEMNPHFRWFVEEVRKLDRKVMVRCNLTILLANVRYRDLPRFFARNQVHVISSLPHYSKNSTDRQRGGGVFDLSIKALQILNEAGYGRKPDLKLDLVYNPNGAFLPGAQAELETEFKRSLKERYGIDFNQLLTITNMPISRFLEFLQASGNLESYMEKLVASYNPLAAQSVMCRSLISVSWDGFLYDCDFNQMLDLKVRGDRTHIRDFDYESLKHRPIVVEQHCYGCTAGCGSSCGGSLA